MTAIDKSLPGFPRYTESNLPKVNSMRENYTQPDFYGIPILHDMDVQFDHASDIGNKPASCYTCCLHNEPEGTCMLIGPTLKVVKLLSKGIEYWPCCGNHSYGDPHGGKPLYLASLDPGNLGLIWINAPAVGQKYGGANCNGTEGGDDCDHYQVKEGGKRESPQGFCRVLQRIVEGGDVCTVWHDDDELPWQEAKQLIMGTDSDASKKALARSILGREDDK